MVGDGVCMFNYLREQQNRVLEIDKRSGLYMFLIGIEVRIVFSVAQNIILYLQLVTAYLLPSGGKEHGFTVDEIEFLHYGDHV